MLSVKAECRYIKCFYTECCYAECLHTECLYAECCYAECHGTFLWPLLIPWCNKLVCSSLSVTSTLIKYLQARLEPTQVESRTTSHPLDRLPALAVNIMMFLWLTMTNTLAFYGMELITTTQGVNVIKRFSISLTLR